MIAGIKIENELCDRDHAFLGVVCHLYARIHSTCVQNLTILASAIPEISLGPQILKLVT